MSNNKVYNNYIHGCALGIYTRFQRDMEIINNIVVNCNLTTEEPTGGKAITLDWHEMDPAICSHPHQKPLDVGTIKIYNNTIADNYLHGIYNAGYNTLEIFNNILVNNGTTEEHGQGQVLFTFTGGKAFIDNNLYYGSGCWRWENEYDCDYEAWQGGEPGNPERDGQSIIDSDPDFITVNDIDYAINYGSPAKNRGMYLSSVNDDIESNPRPYWNRDFDIGAYEIEDTQVKLAAISGSPLSMNFTLEKLGETCWEKTEEGWIISSDQNLSSATFEFDNSLQGFDQDNFNTYRGFKYKWLDWSNDNSEEQIGTGFYKLSNSLHSSDYIYLDLRDAVQDYRLNIYVRYYPDNHKYFYFRENSWQELTNGEILRIWDIPGGTIATHTNELYQFWEHCLVPLEKDNHPYLVWGHFDFLEGVDGYSLYRKYHSSNFSLLTVFETNILNFSDETVNINQIGSLNCSYYLEATGQWDSPRITNTVEYAVIGPGKEAASAIAQNYSYDIGQNYPNPFNPATCISFSIGDAGVVTLKLYDVMGREIKVLLNEELNPGSYSYTFNLSDLPSGNYFYQITANKYRNIKKLQLLK